MARYAEREHTNPDGTVVKILCNPDFDMAGIGERVEIGPEAALSLGAEIGPDRMIGHRRQWPGDGDEYDG